MKKTFVEAINDALHIAMRGDDKVIAYGLGIDDPKAIFETTKNLGQAFGKDRVFDMPISENAMTGVAVGVALGGYRPILVHQRLDFALLSLDQIVNSAAKWYYMFGGGRPVPMVIRMIIGRGWGQGPTHSQALHAWLAHIPGLKVVMPSTPADAKGLLLSSIADNNPVLFLEHRWLHNSVGEVPEGDVREPLGTAAVIRAGSDLTIAGFSLMVAEARRAAAHLEAHGVHAELIDLRTIRPIDWPAIEASVRKTGRLIALDIGSHTGSVAGEIVSHITEVAFDRLKAAPARICLPDHATPTSPALTRRYYPGAAEIVAAAERMLGRDLAAGALADDGSKPHDVPGDWFKGPF